jgi:hypothetical protein
MDLDPWLYSIDTGLELQGLQGYGGGRKLYLVQIVCWEYDIDIDALWLYWNVLLT